MSTSAIIGDLSSLPPADKRLWNEEIHALHQIIKMGCPEADTLREIIGVRRQILDRELRERDLLTAIISDRVHFQLRARSDWDAADIVVEQWVPSVGCWLTSGRFPLTATADQIVIELHKGDPRRTSAVDTLADTREAAAARRASIDATTDLKVRDAVNDLSPRALGDFLAVEGALHTGETITSRGDDRRLLDKLESRTRDAAAAGDTQAQAVLTHGVQDDALCRNPGDNPLVR